MIKKYIQEVKNKIYNKRNNRIGLYYWSPNDHRGKENFGDYLSKVVVKGVIENHRPQLSQAITYYDGDSSERLFAIGSIIHHARDNEIIWGSGINGKALGRKIKSDYLDVRMVRGPLTRKILLDQGIECPRNFGDPGLLVSDVFNLGNAERVNKKYPYSLVLNLNDVGLYEKEDYIIYPDWGLERVIRRIRASEIVISTSLHGLVIAEAYGVPARHLLSFGEPVFKYMDYYLGTGRTEVQFAQSLSEALDLGGVRPPKFDAEAMISSFPFDILERLI